jgi:PAS domain S-box-containing protein
LLVHNYFKAHVTFHVTIRCSRLAIGIDGDKMDETVVESSAKPILDLNEKIRVLHVDDDSGLLKITKQCLEMEASVQVDTAISVEEAFKKMEKEKYDVIISDYKMPTKDGLEFLKELREKGNAIPFIMFTGKGREEVAIKALNLGANQYLNKVGETETVYTELAHSITELAKTRKAEKKQCESEKKFRNLFEKANDGLVFVDLSGRIVDVNQKAAEMTEKRKEDIVGRSFLDLGLVSSKNLPVLVEKLRQQATGKATEKFEFEIEKENGEKRLIEINSAIIQENNVQTGSLAIVRDVTERKRTEEALRKSEAELRAQFYGTPDLIMILDRKHRYVRINRSRFLSYDVEGFIGRDAIDPLPPNQRDLARSNVDQCFATGKIQEFEHTLRNGEWVRARVVPLQSTNTVDQVMIISTDITESKKNEQELRRFSSAVKTSLDGIITGDLNGNVVDANEAVLKMYGSDDKRDLIGKNVQSLLVERDRTRALQNAIETTQTGQGKTVEYSALTKNGIEVPIEVTTQLLVDEKGEPTGFVDIVRDLTERKKAEEALRESEERYSRLSAAAFEGIGICEQGKIIDANDQLAKMLGYEPSELVGKDVLDFVAPESRDLVTANVQKGYEGPYEHLAMRKDGSVFPVEIRARSIPYKGHTARVSAIRDIAERKKAEKDIRKAVSLLNATLESTADGILVVDTNGKITSFNKKLVEMWQIPKDVVLSNAEPDHVNLKRVNGRALDFLTEQLKNPDQFVKSARELILTPELETYGALEFKDGKIFEFYSKPQRVDGTVVGRVWSFRGVTERKKAEKALRYSEQKYREIFENATDAIITIDLNGNVTDVNNAVLRSGYVKEGIIGKNILEFVPKEYWPIITKDSSETFQGKPTRNEVEVRTPKGTIIGEYRASPTMEEGHIVGAQLVLRDITERKRMERTLGRLASAVDCAVDGIAIADIKGIIQFVNPAWALMHGYMTSELLGKHLSIFHTEEQMKKDVNPFNEKVLKTGSNQGEVGHVKKDRTVFPTLMTVALVRDENGSPSGFVGTAEDITERKQTEEALMVSEERYRNFFENSKDLMVTYDLNGNITAVNRVAAEYGFARNENMGKNMLEFVPETELPRLRKEVEEILQGKSVENEIEIDTPKGKRIFEYISSPIKERGEIVGIQGSYKDVTSRRRTEEALKASEERYRNLAEELQRFSTAVNASVDGIVISDMEGRIIELNHAALKLYSANEKKDLTGKNSLELVAPEEREKLIQNMKETVTKGYAGAKEINAVTMKGERIPVEVTTTLIRDAEGHSVGFLGIIRDLAERKNQHRLLEENQQKFAGLFSGNPEATVYVDPDMHILDVNPRFESLFGYSVSEIKGKNINDVIVPENLLEEGRMLDEKAAEGCVYHDTFRKRKDGSLIPVSVSAAPINVHDKMIGYVWLYKDISQQKTVEEALKESEERFKASFAGGPEASVYLTPDFQIQDVNRRFEQLFGYSLAEIKGKQLDDVVVQKDKKKEAAMLNEKAVGGYVYHDTVRRRKDGSIVPVSISAAPIVIKGQLSGLVGTYKDISDLKSAEEKLAVMNEKLRVVGGLTRHDVRNKLSIVTGNAYLIKRKLKDHPEAMEDFEELESACAAIVQLLEFARDYERLRVEELTYVDLEDSIEKTVSLFTNMDQTKIVNECHGLTVLADSLLSKLFYNLIDNSLKHGSHVTRIGISCEESKDELRLVYEDNGVGITQEAKPRLFSEGYTTGKGSGHGLYLIRKMMEAYGWSIRETGLPGKGARFVIAIPKLNKQGKENYLIRQTRVPSAEQM